LRYWLVVRFWDKVLPAARLALFEIGGLRGGVCDALRS